MTQINDRDPLVDNESKGHMNDYELEQLALRKLMSDKAGRSFMWSYLNQCGIFSTGFHANPHLMSHISGRRDAGRILEHELKNVSMRFYLLMLEENEDGG